VEEEEGNLGGVGGICGSDGGLNLVSSLGKMDHTVGESSDSQRILSDM
jgi:hypothetical protein